MGGWVYVSDGRAISSWVEQAVGLFGGIDIVVANVSALSIGNDEESWQQGFDVDMMGTVRLVNAAMPYLEKCKAPSIVTIASVSGREIDFAAGPYGAFKAALTQHTQGLAYSLAPKGIRANTVSPGNTYFAGGVWETIEKNNPELFAASLALNPTGRMATPRRSPMPLRFLPVRRQVSSMARTLWSMAHSPAGYSFEGLRVRLQPRFHRPAGNSPALGDVTSFNANCAQHLQRRQFFWWEKAATKRRK